VLSQTRVLQQEAIIKNVLSRTGVASPGVATAHVIPTDQIKFPATEAVEPIQDLIARALASRPELAQTSLQVENSKIGLEGTKSALKPMLDAVGTLQNSGLAGQRSTLTPGGISTINPYFLGGYGTAMGQVVRRISQTTLLDCN